MLAALPPAAADDEWSRSQGELTGGGQPGN